ncbi:MAG: exo-alpha-sialidase, partial [Sandaracinaceae bacterium]|nr:exo-alpha-sialidase [Sandaracinaceae bacterium]
GECISGGAGTDAGPPRMDGGTGPDLVVATGGCSVGARTSSRGVWLFMLLGVVALASRRRRAGGSLLAVLLAAPLAAGCAVDPYCLANCDAGPGGPDSAVDAEVADAQPGDARVFQDGCLVGAPEECNDFDDNCNGLIDEGFDLTSDEENCGACGTSCVRPGARIECQDSECTFVACFDSYYVQDGEDALTDGCNYRCFVSNGGVEACDTLDNDCDQSTDEDFDLQNDELNCGRCGQECRFFRTTTATCDMGTCRFDPMTDCEPGYIDRDGMQDTGCEFECTPTGDEICDGLDNDCDGMTDEDFNLDSSITDCGRCGRACSFPNATPHCTTGTCGFDPMVDCAPGHSDRNGVQLDGATTDSGGACSNAPGGVATGICTATGALTCSNATLICVGAPEPTRETCNGADDDCDGVVDDAPADEGRVCAPPIGTCTVGLSVCNSGRLDCVRTVEPPAEICNGLDDDCDGGVDDGPTDASIGTACGTDVGECAAGTFQCDPSGRIVCAGGAGAVLETCNGLDDDCDGTADDDPVDAIGSCGSAVGACVQGSLSCSGGTVICTGGIGPSAETCNNQDDNCDGTTDESITAACYTGAPATRGMGLCRDGASTCAAGTMSACAGQVLPALETCDNRDEDCDGTADDGVTQSCYTFSSGTPGVGICRTGVQSCSAGVFTGACAGEIGPAAEACNNTDDDCDGSTDEASGGGPLTQSCYTGPGGTAGVGTCRTGTQTCSVGAFGSCIGDVVPAREWCGDTLDTDCDARSDTMEGCLSPGTELRLDGPASGSGSGQQTAPGAAHSFDVAMASAGNPGGRNVYVVWSDLRNGNADVFFLRSTDGGNTWGTILNLTSGLGDRAVQPVVAAAYDASISNDRVYVAYQRVSGGIRHVRVARSSDSGASFTDSGDLDTTATTDNFKHRLAVSPNGQRVVLAWEQLRTDDLTRRILSRASTNSGGTFAAERLISVNGGAAPNAGKPQVAVTSSGRFVWVWRERRAPRTTFDIFATYSDDATTTPPGAREARIDSDPGDNRDVNELRIAGDGNHLYLLYRDLSTVTTGDSDIVFARSTNDGGAWTSQRTLDDPSGEVSSSTSPAIAIDPGTAGTGGDERVYAVWIDTREGTQVYLSGSNDAGATFQPPVRASNANGQAVSGIVAAPVVAFAGSSTLIVAYTNGAAGATSVRAASSPDGGATWNLTDPALNTVTRNSDSPAIAAFSSAGTPSLGAVVTWVDFRSGTFQNGDIYRVRVGR